MSPDRFREELKRFDRQLDFVYNGKKSRWEIIGTDRKNIKYVIKVFKLGEINTAGVETIKELYECSPTKQGGAAALNRRMDDLIAEEDKREQDAQDAAIAARLDDAWMHYQYKEGTRVSFSTPTTDGPGLVITDKRRVHDTP